MTLKPIVETYANLDGLSVAAAHHFVAIANDGIAARGRSRVVLSGGSTPERLYRTLALPLFRPQLDWSKLDLFWGDERAVPPTHRDSNYRMIKEALLDPLEIPSERIHRMHGEESDLDAAARDYQRQIARVFGISTDGPPPVCDLILLGMGTDGHTASLFPHTAALREPSRWVVANHVPKLNATRITMTVPILSQASVVLFLVAGAEKAEILPQVFDGPSDPERLPAQLACPRNGRLLWLIDQAAASQLRTRSQ